MCLGGAERGSWLGSDDSDDADFEDEWMRSEDEDSADEDERPHRQYSAPSEPNGLGKEGASSTLRLGSQKKFARLFLFPHMVHTSLDWCSR